MTDPRYDASQIQVLAFDAAVRRWPGMYFGAGPDDPRLPTRVLGRVVGWALHPDSPVVAEIHGDLAFSVRDDACEALDEDGMPRLGYLDSLIGPDRWCGAAAAALSTRTVVEVRRDGRGVRQELAGVRPLGAPEAFVPPAGRGTRMRCALDAAALAPGAAIVADPAAPDLYGPWCEELDGTGRLLLRDLR
ncbi:hypothetical protein ACH4U3_42175 [Streptomyces griseoruber]|uniref:hypothetical protein n=1 Tax=Streptomyces griseoruber TaxID=1943 RepID=UPI0037AB9AA9